MSEFDNKDNRIVAQNEPFSSDVAVSANTDISSFAANESSSGELSDEQINAQIDAILKITPNVNRNELYHIIKLQHLNPKPASMLPATQSPVDEKPMDNRQMVHSLWHNHHISIEKRREYAEKYAPELLEQLPEKEPAPAIIPAIEVDASQRLIAIQPEEARLSILFKQSHLYRIYACIHDMVASDWYHLGSSMVMKDDLLHHLRATYGLEFTDRRFRQWIAEGDGFYWDDLGDRLYKTGRIALGNLLADRAMLLNPDTVKRNRPGTDDERIESGGTHQAWNARLYGAWLHYRENVTISKKILSTLFGRSKQTLLNWEELIKDKLTKVANYQQTTNPELAPDGAEISVTRSGKTLYVKQLPNTYESKIGKHKKNGSRRSVRRSVNHLLPAGNARRVLRVFHDTQKNAKAHCKKYRAEISAVMLRIGLNKHGHGLWEVTPDGYKELNQVSRADFDDEYNFRKEHVGNYGVYMEQHRKAISA